MLKVTGEELDHMESLYSGIIKTISRFEDAELPACSGCGAADTASVQVGVIGRTMHIAVATTKFKLIPNGPAPGKYYCNSCGGFFD